MKTLIFITTIAVCLFVNTVFIRSQILDENFPIVDGIVYSIAQDETYTYIGGDFNNVFSKDDMLGSSIILRNNSTEINKDSFPFVNGTVRCSFPDGNGGWYIGGTFTKVANIERSYLAHIHANGLLDLNWQPNPNGLVNSISVYDDEIYVAGEFTIIGGQARNFVAKLNNIEGDADLNWNPNPNKYVDCVTANEKDIFVGGQFNFIGDMEVNNIAKLNKYNGIADTSWNALMTNEIRNRVNCLVIENEYLYVGGRFDKIGGLIRNNIAKLSLRNGLSIVNWNPNSNNVVNTIVVNNKDIYVGGIFTNIGNRQMKYVAKLNSNNGQIDTNWEAKLNNNVRAITIVDNDIYIGGWFKLVDNNQRSYIAKLDLATGQLDSNWILNASSFVSTICNSNGNILIGGGFSAIKGITRNCIFRVNTESGIIDRNWNPNASSVIRSIAVDADDIYVGGGFGIIGRKNQKFIAKLKNINGDADLNWNVEVENWVYSITVSNNYIYFAGLFGSVNNKDIFTMVKMSLLNHEVDLTWNPLPSDFIPIEMVSNLISEEGNIYALGNFTKIGEHFRNRIAKLNNYDGKVDINWNPVIKMHNNVYSLTLDEKHLYLGGTFDTISHNYRRNIAKLDKYNGEVVDTWQPIVNRSVISLTNDEKYLYLGGEFTLVDGINRNRLAKLNKVNGELDLSWNPNSDDIVNTLYNHKEFLYVGGSFNVIGGQNRKGLARFNKNINVSVNEDFTDYTNFIEIYPNPTVQNKITVLAKAIGVNNLEIYDIYGKKIKDYANIELQSGDIINLELPQNMIEGAYVLSCQLKGKRKTVKFIYQRQ